MYKKFGCIRCDYKGYTEYWHDDFAPTWHKIRCECSLIKTKKYKSYLNNKLKKRYKFYDNNVSCNNDNNIPDRSW